jgi:hypothetical protein
VSAIAHSTKNNVASYFDKFSPTFGSIGFSMSVHKRKITFFTPGNIYINLGRITVMTEYVPISFLMPIGGVDF